MKRYDADVIVAGIVYLVQKKLPPYVKAKPLDIQVLTPMRKGLLGVERLNEVLQKYLNPPDAKKKEKEYLLVDGYNIIYAWEDLKELADANLHAAQTKLMDILSNYQGFKKCTLILVFDAYKIEGHAEEVITYHNIHVVYTKEAETADQYIEKTVHKIGRENQVTVATSDGLEQIIIMGQGAHRMSARGLRDEIKATENQIRQQWHEKRQSSKNYLIDNISDEMAQYMKEKRLGKQ